VQIHCSALLNGLELLAPRRRRWLQHMWAPLSPSSTCSGPAAIRTIFAQSDTSHMHEQFEVIAAMLGRQLPKVETMLRARDDLLSFTAFPQAHWRKIWSTNRQRCDPGPLDGDR
jgi:putative transposase